MQVSIAITEWVLLCLFLSYLLMSMISHGLKQVFPDYNKGTVILAAFINVMIFIPAFFVFGFPALMEDAFSSEASRFTLLILWAGFAFSVALWGKLGIEIISIMLDAKDEIDTFIVRFLKVLMILHAVPTLFFGFFGPGLFDYRGFMIGAFLLCWIVICAVHGCHIVATQNHANASEEYEVYQFFVGEHVFKYFVGVVAAAGICSVVAHASYDVIGYKEMASIHQASDILFDMVNFYPF